MTADEFLRDHGNESGIELVGGLIVQLPMNDLRHGEVCANVGGIIGDFVKQNKWGRGFSNCSFVRTRPDAVRGPDVMFISYQTLPADQPTPPLELVAEVRSPTDTVRAMTRKADEYLEAGVRVVLVFDPASDNIVVFRPDELPQRLHNGDELTLPDVLPGFSVPVRQFFE